MEIWIRNNWYTVDSDILIVRLTDQDKKNIKDMRPDCDLYCQYDESMFTTRGILRLLRRLK